MDSFAHQYFSSFLFLLLLSTATPVFADHYPVNTKIDVLNYQFTLTVTDLSDQINVSSVITVLFKEPGVQYVRLDLINQSEQGKGMLVESVMSNGKPVEFTHTNNALIIKPGEAPAAKSTVQFIVRYHGIPADGLHIGPTKFGDRSFFSDNWPNKARNWLAVIDHPSDKATCEFIIQAPLHYRVVCNGLLKEESFLDANTKRTHWKQSVPIAPWLFTIGIADFAVQYVDDYKGKSIETWVYARDRDAGFYDFSFPVKESVSFFEEYIGPYVYEKLAAIESPVVGGGMEAASAIGYSDKLVTGKRTDRTRNVIIHELAHQWFGNSVTENNWDNAWLSEAFATCFTLLFIEHAYGKEVFRSELAKAKQLFNQYYAKDPHYPIIADRTAEETTVTNYAVTYQKGAYVLLMLRDMIGEAAFKEGIRSYYKKFMNANATTADFIKEMEMSSHKNLSVFFNQWLYRGDCINAKAGWTYDATKKQVLIQLNQQQTNDSLYRFSLDVVLQFPDNSTVIKKIEVNKQSEKLIIPVKTKPKQIDFDPKQILLANIEGKENEASL